MDYEEKQKLRNLRVLVESYFTDFSTNHCKEIFLYSSKIFRKILQDGALNLFDYITNQNLFLSNPLYNEIYVKGIHLIEDCATPALFQFIMDYECNKLMNSAHSDTAAFSELHLLKTCMYYLRTCENADFETLARKTIMPTDPELFDKMISELSHINKIQRRE